MRLHGNPKEFYDTIKGYLEGESYEDFLAGTHQIKWISADEDPVIIKTLRQQHVSMEGMLP
ncbi:MAG TPA: hypothetical protein VFX66_02190, partial [Sulfuricurvum sp.]|nr:hypothetical protein [Sulfuricurvum sp.]